MLCLVHGYGLSGSGSNLWTRAVSRALCQQGETFHLVCQEHRPEQYDWVGASYVYDADGVPEQRFERQTDLPGRCIVHRPQLDLLPVYVQPSAGATEMASILDMSDAQVEHYLELNVPTLRHLADEHAVTAFHVNHVVLMAQAVHRVHDATGVPFAVMPHGSAIEYIVKHDERMHRMASDTLRAAHRIFTLNREMRSRVLDVFGELPEPETKMVTVPVGVDVSDFTMVAPAERQDAVERLKGLIAGRERGKRPEQSAALREQLHDDMSLTDLQEAIEATSDYAARRPDAGLETKLDSVDWADAPTILFVGRLLGHKGVTSLVVALPSILREHPNARLLLAGAGPLREALEALVAALGDGQQRLARHIVEWGGALEGEHAQPIEAAARYLDRLDAQGSLEAYFETAKKHLTPDRVLFTGYLEHDALGLLYAVSDVAVFPSVVREASPMVVPESMASGCFPVGTDYGGMAAALDAVDDAVPEEAARLTRLRADAEHTVADIADAVPGVLALRGQHREALRELAVERFDWRNIAAGMAEAMHAMP